MTIGETITTALETVTSNSWAVELPDQPTWPAIVYEIDSTPEDGWAGGGAVVYEQHVITVMTFAKTRTELSTLRAQIKSPIEGITGYMGDEEHGDADYEKDPRVYAYFQNFRIRERI